MRDSHVVLIICVGIDAFYRGRRRRRVDPYDLRRGHSVGKRLFRDSL